MGASRAERVEVITSVERRRRYSDAEKLRYVAESQMPGQSVAKVAKRHGLNEGLIFGWRRAIREGRLGPAEPPTPPASVALADATTTASAPFIRIQTSAATPATMRIGFPNGVTLELPVETEPQRIAALMQALQAAR
jgi:transposase-like protein